MLAVNAQEPLARNQPQPEEERNLRFLPGILGQLLHQVQKRLLEHVRRVHPTLKPPIEPQPDHLPQPFSVAVKQARQRLCVARGRATDQRVFLSRFGIKPHRDTSAHGKITAPEPRSYTSVEKKPPQQNLRVRFG
jgi:hypothetical protein